MQDPEELQVGPLFVIPIDSESDSDFKPKSVRLSVLVSCVESTVP